MTLHVFNDLEQGAGDGPVCALVGGCPVSAAWILVPVTVAVSSILFIDARRHGLRILGFTLLFGGLLSIFAVVYVVTTAGERDAAQCASRGGVPANGECWIDGERQ